jgi:hypothetical protein
MKTSETSVRCRDSSSFWKKEKKKKDKPVCSPRMSLLQKNHKSQGKSDKLKG